ncbi:MAG: hypothetical protein JO129_00820 [Candidatus Dependentiae bacterium]|nr:hypothetical protein [Candidatus Dependentiae bacterium]
MKKIFALASLLVLNQHVLQAKETIVLSSPLLRVADNAGVFHGPIVEILQTRIDFVNLIQGEKEWRGVIMDIKVANTNNTLTIYCRRPEIICGATFIALTPDHELVKTLTTSNHKNEVTKFIENMTMKSFYDRQINSTNEGVFTGSYAINPFTQELLPIYVSDYALECFDIRHSKARLGFAAHNSKDFDFAKFHNLPIKVVVDIHQHDKKNDSKSGSFAVDKHGVLKEAYLGEYSSCFIINSGDNLNNLSLKDAANYVIKYLENNNIGRNHSEFLQYMHNNQMYSIKDLTKIETAIYKSMSSSEQIEELKKEIKIALNYAQADFLEIVEKFLMNVKNTKTLMISLIEESCMLRENSNCYLLRWCQLKGHENEKEVFQRDITSLKELTRFCKDLINFLGDLVHSCPKALENIRKQNP